MNQYAGNSLPVNEIRSRRRMRLVEHILDVTSDPHLRSFALARALDGLGLPELERLVDELADVYGDSAGRIVPQTPPEK